MKWGCTQHDEGQQGQQAVCRINSWFVSFQRFSLMIGTSCARILSPGQNSAPSYQLGLMQTKAASIHFNTCATHHQDPCKGSEVLHQVQQCAGNQSHQLQNNMREGTQRRSDASVHEAVGSLHPCLSLTSLHCRVLFSISCSVDSILFR